MYLSSDTLIGLSKLVGAVGVISGAAVAVIKAFLRYRRQQREIERLKQEDEQKNSELTLLCFGLSACLDGLCQLGANHTVPIAKDKLDKYLNNKAHKRF